MQEYEQIKDHLIDLLEDLDGQLDDITAGEKNIGEYEVNKSVNEAIEIETKNNVDPNTIAHEEIIKLWQAIGRSDKNQ